MSQITVDIEEKDGLHMKMLLCEGSLEETEFEVYITVSGNLLLFHIEEKWYQISMENLVGGVVGQIVDKMEEEKQYL